MAVCVCLICVIPSGTAYNSLLMPLNKHYDAVCVCMYKGEYIIWNEERNVHTDAVLCTLW